MKTETKRLCFYPKGLHRITGKISRQSFRLLKSFRKELNKLQNEFVSVKEFWQYTTLKIEHDKPLITRRELFFLHITAFTVNRKGMEKHYVIFGQTTFFRRRNNSIR